MSEQLTQLVKEWNETKSRRWIQNDLDFRTPFEFIVHIAIGADFEFYLGKTTKERHKTIVTVDDIRRAFASEIYNRPEIFVDLIDELNFILKLEDDESLEQFFRMASDDYIWWPADSASIRGELLQLRKTVKRLLLEEKNKSQEEKKKRMQREEGGQSEDNPYFLDHEWQRDRWQSRCVPGPGTMREYVQHEVLFERADVHYGQYVKGKWVLSSEDLHRIFEERVYSEKPCLSILLDEIEHLLSLEGERVIKEAYFSLNRFSFWPEGVSVKKEFELMAREIHILMTRQDDQKKGNLQ